MIFIGILIAIIMFSVIVLIHEFGHFSAARKFGVKVEEFGLGIPPKAKELFTDKKGTKYTLNWLPLGGFVRLKGENPALLKNKNDPEALSNKSYFAQSVIILAGVFMNFLLATVIFSILFFIGVKPIGINSQIKTDLDLKIIPTQEQAFKSGLLVKGSGIILYPVKDSIAEKAGIREGDVLTVISLTSNSSPLEERIVQIKEPENAIKIIGNNAGKTIYLTIQRNKKNLNISLTPLSSKGEGLGVRAKGKIGSYLSPNITINKDFEYKYGLIDSIKYGFLETYNQSLLTFKAIGILVKKLVNPETPKERTDAIENMKGPIGIVDLVANSLKAGIVFIVIIGAIISINLGVFNLLPIPALDGGRFLFISINALISKLFGKKAITETLENIIHIFFFIILIALSLLIGYNDVVNIISR